MSVPAGVAVVAVLAVAGAPAAALRVRASSVVAPCVEAAVRAWPDGRGVQVETAPANAAGPADVIVASAVELTRALEGGAAEVGSDVDVARVPWVVQVRPGGPQVRQRGRPRGRGRRGGHPRQSRRLRGAAMGGGEGRRALP